METNTKTLSVIVEEQKKEIELLREQLKITLAVACEDKCLPCILKFLKTKK
jgi:hypothetical protein